MKTRRLLLLLALLACLAPAAIAGAAPILSLSPASQNVSVGDTASVDIVVSNLGAAEAVGSFDLDITFNGAVVSFEGYTLGSGLGAPGDVIDLSFGDVGGVIDLAALSLLDGLDLKLLQGSSFVLATLKFMALANGVSPLVASQSIFADAAGLELVVNDDTGVIRVGGVPEPISLLLVGTGMAAVFARRRTRIRG